MASYERTYGTARAVFTLLEFIGWLVTVGGVIGLIVGFNGLGYARSNIEGIAAISGVAFGILFALLGLISVAFVQMSRANVDQAEMTRDMLRLTRNATFSEDKVIQNTPAKASNVVAGRIMKAYRGYNILREDAGVSVSGIPFGNVMEAEEYINKLEENTGSS